MFVNELLDQYDTVRKVKPVFGINLRMWHQCEWLGEPVVTVLDNLKVLDIKVKWLSAYFLWLGGTFLDLILYTELINLTKQQYQCPKKTIT